MRKILLSLIACTFAVAAAVAQERPPQGPVGTVTLSRSEFDRLLDLSTRSGAPPERAPLAAALGRADITVRVDGGVARASIALEGEVFHSGVVKVPLIAGTTLLDARLANGPLPLVSENNALVGLILRSCRFCRDTGMGDSPDADAGTRFVRAPGTLSGKRDRHDRHPR